MTTLDEIGGKLSAGEPLDRADTEAIVGTDDLVALGMLADTRRREFHGDRVTFVRVQEIDVASTLSAGVSVTPAAGELRIVGGLDDRAQALAVTRAVASRADGVPVTGFAVETLAELCRSDPSALADLLAELKQAGLSLVAEARVGRLQGPEWLEVVGRAGLSVGRLTVGEFGEPDGLEIVRRVATWGGDVKHVHAFAPLPRTLGSQPTTGYGDVRQVALARVLVDNIDSIQVDWSLYGPKLAQVALTFGADDVDRVSPLDTLERGWRRTPLEEITRNICASALVPIQRNGCYETLER